MTFDSGEEITWIYDAAGVKLYKVSTNADPTPVSVRKDYLGGIEYADNVVEAIYHSEGRAVPNGSDYTFEYTLKDHLGNSRVTFADLDKDGEVDASEILQTNHYYPFGMAMELPSQPMGNPNNAYQYNGKELNSDFGLDWLDYGARWYDASISRWSAVDPLAEKYASYSTYHFVGNNSINNIEIDGRYFTGDTDKVEDVKKHAEEILGQSDDEIVAEWFSTVRNKDFAKKLAGIVKKTMQTTLDEIDALEESDVEYHIDTKSKLDGDEGEAGKVIYNSDESRIDVMLGGNPSLETTKHELKHAHQFDAGEIAFLVAYDANGKAINISSNTMVADLGDEAYAYNEGLFFSNLYRGTLNKFKGSEMSYFTANYGSHPSYLYLSGRRNSLNLNSLMKDADARLATTDELKNMTVLEYMKMVNKDEELSKSIKFIYKDPETGKINE